MRVITIILTITLTFPVHAFILGLVAATEKETGNEIKPEIVLEPIKGQKTKFKLSPAGVWAATYEDEFGRTIEVIFESNKRPPQSNSVAAIYLVTETGSCRKEFDYRFFSKGLWIYYVSQKSGNDHVPSELGIYGSCGANSIVSDASNLYFGVKDGDIELLIVSDYKKYRSKLPIKLTAYDAVQN